MPPVNLFWDVSLSNIITWGILIAGFLGSQYVAVKLLGERMNGFDAWKKTHEQETKSREVMISELKVGNERLKTLAEAAERRLEKLEDKTVFVRSADLSQDYPGPERRRRDG
jgi:hypothetical protein